MDYKLAKELKDAGFPQRSLKYWKHLTDGPHGKLDQWVVASEGGLPPYTSHRADSNFISIPTLEELVEACGDDIESMIHRGNGAGDNWEVRSKHQRFNGTTLIEAVARLWLALNSTPKQPQEDI